MSDTNEILLKIEMRSIQSYFSPWTPLCRCIFDSSSCSNSALRKPFWDEFNRFSKHSTQTASDDKPDIINQ